MLYPSHNCLNNNGEEKAIAHYREAAKVSVVAKEYLGDCYLLGKGTPRDEQKAVYWYDKAANQTKSGHEAYDWENEAQAYQENGNAAYKSRFVSEDHTFRRPLLLQELDPLLYKHYPKYRQIGVIKRTDRDREWFYKLAKLGSPKAAFELGFAHQHGRGGHSEDLAKAEEYYRQAAEQKTMSAVASFAKKALADLQKARQAENKQEKTIAVHCGFFRIIFHQSSLKTPSVQPFKNTHPGAVKTTPSKTSTTTSKLGPSP